MRIAILHQYGLGGSGSGVYTYHLAEALSLAGHEVHVLCRPTCSLPPSLPFAVHPDVPAGAPVMYARAETPGCPAWGDLTALGLRASMSELEARTRRFLLSVRPEAILANHLFPFPLLLGRLMPRGRIPAVVVSHGTALQYLLDHRADLAQRVRQALTDTTIRVAALNPPMRRRLLDFDPRLAPRIVALPVGVDGRQFRPAESPGDRKRALITLAARLGQTGQLDTARRLLAVASSSARLGIFAGRLVADKGVPELLSALGVPGALPPEVTMALVGDGPLRAQVDEAASALRQAGRRVITIPCLGRPEMAMLYRGARFAVTPSTAGEAFPLVLVEALAAGLPVLCPDHSGFAALGPSLRRAITQLHGQEALPSLGDTAAEIAGRLPGGLRRVADLPTDATSAAALRALVIPRYDWSGVARRFVTLAVGLAAAHQARRQPWASSPQARQSTTI